MCANVILRVRDNYGFGDINCAWIHTYIYIYIYIYNVSETVIIIFIITFVCVYNNIFYLDNCKISLILPK